MTFDEIVSTAMERLNLTSDDARKRIGVFVNARYKRISTSIGMITSRRTNLSITVDPSDTTTYPSLPEITVVGLEKILRVQTTGSGDAPQGILTLQEVTYEEATSRTPFDKVPRKWAVKRMGPGQVIIVVDGTPTTPYPLTFEGYEIADTLADDIEPNLPTDFHDILIEGAKADELKKMEKGDLAAEAKAEYEIRLGELRQFIAVSGWLAIYQGKHNPGPGWYHQGFVRIAN